MIGAGLPSAWCFSTQMKGFQDVFLKSVTNHSIHFHFVSKWLAIDILWKSDENQQKSQGCHIQNNTLKPKKISFSRFQPFLNQKNFFRFSWNPFIRVLKHRTLGSPGKIYKVDIT